MINEVYGELVLSPDCPYWIWPICSTSDLVRIEYEVRPEDDAKAPSILIVDDLGLEEYQIRANSYPIMDGPLISSTVINVPWYGEWEFSYGYNGENFHLKNIPKKGRSLNDWGEEQKLVDYYTIECLTYSSSDAVQIRRIIKPELGNYYLVFDWTDDIPQEPDTERVSVQVSLRATEPIDEEVIEETATASVELLYGRVADQRSPVVETAVNVARAICSQAPDAFQGVSVSEINDVAPQAGQLVSSVNIVLTILENQLGFDPSIRRRLTTQMSAWTRWGMFVLPVASSFDQLLNDACTVAEAEPAEVTEDVENMLMSLDIVVADLVAAYFGGAGRAARFVVGLAHKYLLGFVARTLGLKTYLVLLRELYTLSGISEVLSAIKAVTREIAREYDWLDEANVETVESLNEESLWSLDWGLDLFSPECSV
ncbi:hypothetical protein [Halosimplex carlsbadense]|uniref:hypothetical protein n=1 Tax=Halosimplex carlsbadense TaxID=171164 RepID=UPI00067833C8|nr:hypothetical protein [Halosimplex carlsbadense]